MVNAHVRAEAPAGWRHHLRLAAAVLVASGVVALAVVNRATIGSGGASLAGADLEWLVLAVVLTTALWVAGTAAQLGAVPIRPPLTQLFAVQVAAGLVNHVVPGSVGGMSVNVRYLQRAGMTRPAAMTAVGMSSVATFVTHLALVVAVWSFAPAVLPGGAVGHALARPAAAVTGGVGGGTALLVAVAAVGVLGAAAVAVGKARRQAVSQRVRRSLHRTVGQLRREARSLGTVLRHPGRASLLWTGSAMSPVLHSLILVAVYNSLSGGLRPLTVALVYLVASAVAALVPSPGGVGALDVTLVAGLVAAGAPSTTAVATVLGYRLLTVWVPLVPGALVLAVLLRRRIL